MTGGRARARYLGSSGPSRARHYGNSNLQLAELINTEFRRALIARQAHLLSACHFPLKGLLS